MTLVSFCVQILSQPFSCKNYTFLFCKLYSHSPSISTSLTIQMILTQTLLALFYGSQYIIALACDCLMIFTVTNIMRCDRPIPARFYK